MPPSVVLSGEPARLAPRSQTVARDRGLSPHPQAARDVQRAIADAFQLLTRYPESGRLLRRDVRRFVVPRLPYLIFYQVDRTVDEVTIITVRHAARRDENPGR